jgi:predicted ATP-dependent endonuclease of OLD family
MHRLSEIQIVNYKSCQDCTIELSDFTPIVGYNNAGKSNILQAIVWLINPSGLSEPDFFDVDRPVIVRGVIEGIEEDLLDELSDKHRKRIKPFCSDGRLHLKRIQEQPSGYKRDVNLFVRNPDVDDEGSDEAWKANPTGIDGAISALFPDTIEVEAMKDAGEDSSKFKSTTTIGKLISDIMEPIRKEHEKSIKEALEGLTEQLDAEGSNRPEEIKDFDSSITDELAQLFPGISLKLHVPTPQFDDLFKSGTLRAYEDDSEDGREITSLGHGAQRSIQMALIRYLSHVKTENANDISRQILLVEEPELYLHPQAIEQIRYALKQLSETGYQVIYSTHSPIAIDAADIPSTLLIRKTKENGTYARDSLERAVRNAIDDAQSQADTIFSLSHSSQILFSDKVILSEGKTERRLVPFLFENLFGRTLGLEKIALVELGGVDSTGKALRILNAMDIPTQAIVDLDYAFRGAIDSNFIDKDNEDIQACLGIFERLSSDHPFNLSSNGLPTKKESEITSADAFALLANDEEAKPHLKNIHRKLLNEDIWVWEMGDIDHHLGIDGKTESNWSSFKRLINDSTFSDVVDDPEGVTRMFEWMRD